MKLAKYTILDMIDDKIEEIKYINDFIDHFKKMKGNICYDEPNLRDSGFDSWKEFRSNRNKYHIKNRTHPIDDFPLADFSMSKPGAITIIRDDCIDILKILKAKKLESMRADYVSSVFFAIEIANGRLHYMLGSFGIRHEFNTKRTKKSTDKKRENRLQDKDAVLVSFKKLYKNNATKMPPKNKIAREIMDDNTTIDGKKTIYRMKMSKIKKLLEELDQEMKISLPKKVKTIKM